MGSTSDDSVEGLVCICMRQELGFFFPSIVFEESRISDGIDIDMLRGSVVGFPKVRVVVGGIGGMGEIEVLRLVKGLIDGQGSFVPINSWVDILEPRESQDHIFIP